MKIKQIIFADDIIYPAALNDSVIARIYYDLLGDALRLIAPDIAVVMSDDMLAGADFRAKYYGTVGIRPDMAAWSMMAEREPSPRQVAMVQDAFGDSLLIGISLSSSLKKALQKAGIFWLDIIPHPARFVRGPALGIAGNIPDIDLTPWLLTEDILKMQASVAKGRIQGQFYRGQTTSHLDTAVFICQSSASKEVWKAGKPIEIEDFQEEIFGLIKMHDKMLVMRDGYSDPEKIDLFFTQLCPKTSLYKGRFYDLLKRPEVTTVYSLNSDKAIIAKYFGKIGKNLLPASCNFGINISPVAYVPVLNPLSDHIFWVEVMKSLGILLSGNEWPEIKELCPSFFELDSEEISIF